MWSSLPASVREYIYAHDLPMRIAHIDAEYDLPAQEVRVAGLAQRDDETLFIRSAKQGRDWELPGGRIEGDETPEDAVRREFKEETGCDATAVTPIIALMWSFPDSTITQLVFRVELGACDADPADEVDDIAWCADLPEPTSFGEKGHETYEFLVNSELVAVEFTNDDTLQHLLDAAGTRKKSLTVAGVAGGAVAAGLIRRILDDD